MKYLIAILASFIVLTPTVASADGWRGGREHYEHRGGGVNPWPFLAGAVVGGIIVHAASEANEPRVISSRRPEPPVLVNGVWMQRIVRCVQEIVTNRYGDEQVLNRCNYVYVEVPQPPPAN